MATADRKMRFGGLLENPYVSMIQRNILDYGRWQGLAKTLRPLELNTVLDIGCGLGENSKVNPKGYIGVDNSAPRISFAQKHFGVSRFLVADALKLPLKEKSCDLAMLIDTSHHLNDEEFSNIITTMKRVSRKWVLVSDPVLFEGQSGISRFFYDLDRGAKFRSMDGMASLLGAHCGLIMEKTDIFVTFPGLYRHGVFLLRLA
jgi:SAM-dependent methyltransferase